MKNLKKTPQKKAKSKISTKYQIVIPKEIRMVLKDATPGTYAYITPIDSKTIQITLEKLSWADRVRGIVPKGTYGPDPVKYIRKLREGWERRLDRQRKLTEI